jgi:hypothetical protein
MMIEDPSLFDLARQGVAAAWRWSKAGFALVDDDTLRLRKVTCDTCDQWTGLTCRKCGCTRLKVWLATERCPVGKWPSTVPR